MPPPEIIDGDEEYKVKKDINHGTLERERNSSTMYNGRDMDTMMIHGNQLKTCNMHKRPSKNTMINTLKQ